MPSSKSSYGLPLGAPSPVVREEHIEYGFIGRQTKLRAQQHTVWLTQLELAELFDATKQNISLHLKNIFEDAKLDAGSVVKASLTTAADGNCSQTLLYNRDAEAELVSRQATVKRRPK